MAIIHSSNPLLPVKSRQITEIEKEVSVSEVIDILGYNKECVICRLNGEIVTQYDLCISPKDHLEIVQRVMSGGRGGGVLKTVIGAVLIAIGVIVAITSWGTLSALSIGLIGAGLNLVITGVMILLAPPPPSLDGQGSSEEKPTYSISAAKNRNRFGESLPLVLGNYRFAPDHGMQPYTLSNVTSTSLVPSGQSSVDLTYNTFTDNGVVLAGVYHVDTYVFGKFINNATAPTVLYGSTPANSWTVINSPPLTGGGTYPFPVSQDRLSYVEQGPISASTLSSFVFSHAGDFSILGPYYEPISIAWSPWIYHHSPADPKSGLWETAQSFYNNSNLTQSIAPRMYKTSFISSVSPPSLENEKAQDTVYQIFNYGFGDLTIGDFKVSETPLVKFRDDQLFYPTQTPTSWLFTNPLAPHGNVDSFKGGKLTNTTSFNDYLYRDSPDKTIKIVVDIGGRQFTSTGTGFGILSSQYSIEYRLSGTVPWAEFFGAIGGFLIERNVSYPMKYSFTQSVPSGKYEVRVKKLTTDKSDSQSVEEVEFLEVKFFKEDNANYVAQNRVGLTILASEQLNGAISEISSYVQAKCWVWNGSTWVWQFSENPAWWYLYFIRGGYKNTSATGLLSYPYSPTIGWLNNADHPDNGERLFGVGLSDSRIDIQKIIEWAAFCDSKNLKFSAVLDQQKNCMDVLNQIAAVGRAAPSWATGKLGVVWENATDPIVAVFGMANIVKGTFKVTYLNEKLPEEIVCTYNDQDEDFGVKEVRALRPDITGSPKTSARIPLFGVKYAAQAQREANLLAGRQLYQRRFVEFESEAEGLLVTRGDVISLSHDLTQWGYSGRVRAIEITGTSVTKIKIDQHGIPTPQNYVQLRNVDGTLMIHPCTFSGDEITLAPGLFQAVDAPYYTDVDDANAINNLAATTGTVAWDMVWLLDVEPTPGKKLRVIEVSPKSETRFKIVALDEEVAMYSVEYGGPYVAPDYEGKLVAKAFNVDLKKVNDTTQRITWELEGCDAVKVDISLNGGPYLSIIKNGSYSIFGSHVDVYYMSGDSLQIKVTPLPYGAPYAIEFGTLSVNV